VTQKRFSEAERTIYIKEKLLFALSSGPYTECICYFGGTLPAEPLVRLYYRPSTRITERDGLVPGQKLSEEMLKKVLLDLGKDMEQGISSEPGKAMEQGIKPTVRFLGESPAPAKVRGMVLSREDSGSRLSFQVDGHRLYLEIFLTELPADNDEGHRISYTPELLEEESFSLLMYPVEEELSGHLFQILKNLDLKFDPEEYLLAYAAIMGGPVSGTDVALSLGEKWKEQGLPFSEDRLERIREFSSRRNIQTQWDKFIKRQGNLSLSLEDTIETLSLFGAPIWSALCKEEIFFGDWMPDLGRFLD